MAKNFRTPMSKLEKLHDGLGLIRQFQPSAFMKTVGEHLIVGDAQDQNLPAGMKAKLRDLGFGETKDGAHFGFNVTTGK